MREDVVLCAGDRGNVQRHQQPTTTNGVFGHGFTVHRDGTLTVDAVVTNTVIIDTIPRIQIIGTSPA